jgi:predicted Zn finger-like uncharacterized protein
MPIRISCPACSAILNLKDELAGRAVKCPRCGGTIPATATKAPPPAPAFEVGGDDDAPPPPAPRAKAPPRPAPVIVVDDEEDDEDAPRPSKRREKPAKSKRNERILAGMVAYWILAVAVSAWLSLRDPDAGTESGGTTKGRPETESAARPSLDVPGPATLANYQKIQLTETRGELEAMFGPAETPVRNEFALAFSSTSISYRTWLPMVDKGRVMMWRNNKDRLCVCLTPDGRAQAKLFETPTPGSAVSEGKLVD